MVFLVSSFLDCCNYSSRYGYCTIGCRSEPHCIGSIWYRDGTRSGWARWSCWSDCFWCIISSHILVLIFFSKLSLIYHSLSFSQSSKYKIWDWYPETIACLQYFDHIVYYYKGTNNLCNSKMPEEHITNVWNGNICDASEYLVEEVSRADDDGVCYHFCEGNISNLFRHLVVFPGIKKSDRPV